jgi:hypothetical protein
MINFEKALEFAVISSWEELVKPKEHSSIHVEYANQDGTAVAGLQVWSTYKGRGNRICEYSVAASKGSQQQGVQFAGSYASPTLTEALDLIMLNQSQFERPAGRGMNGLVQVSVPPAQNRASAASWWHSMLTEVVRKAPPSHVQPELRLGAFTKIKTQAN